MESFKSKITTMLEESGYSIESKVPEHEITFNEIVDYCSKVSSGYDHKLIDEIQLYKSHNMNVADIFKGRAENIEKYRDMYSQPKETKKRTKKSSSIKRRM